jgi:RNA polymerase sigma factor (sigma-70 family)
MEAKKPVSWDEQRTAELEALLSRFSGLMKVQIYKFNPGRYGLDPEDIAQEIKIKLWRVLSREKEIVNFPSYLRKVVNSSVIDMLRKYRREEGVFLHEKQKRISEMKDDYLAELSVNDYLKERLAEAVDSLIESRRKVVKLFLLDMTIDEIASFYNWSRDKTRNLLYRGLSDLKGILKDKDIDYEDQ